MDEKITVLDPRGQPTGKFGRRGEPGSEMMSIFDPKTQPVISIDDLPRRMAPRLDTLENKTVYLVDTGFAGANEFLQEMQKWFSENMPSVKTVLHVKAGNTFADDPETWVLCKKEADAVVLGVGG
ncbi:MAG: hypothetical protein GX631_09415 [Dehalococcoidales bacterium]|jgi:hypothetical protein|nr:hypothetical protein [Dehalococcoidales bacterium]